MSSKHMVIPVFIPHKGCPFDCIYCNQKAISGEMEDMTEEKIRNIIETHLAYSKNNAYVEIGFYGGSFTGIDRGLQTKYLGVAKEYIDRGKIREIRLSTRPDYIDREILTILKSFYVKTIELGVQSMDDSVLKNSCRGHSSQDVVRSSTLIKEMGFELGIQTMVGLPGSNREMEVDTAKKVVELSPGILRIYPTLVIRGTYLEKLFKDGIYKPLELDEAVETCAELLEIYERNNINVIRIGLQPTDNIQNDIDVVAGPFHPSFRQLVESKIMLKKIENYLREYDLCKESGIIIYTGIENISNLVGQRRVNVEYLKKKYNFNIILIECFEGLKKDIFIKGGVNK